jgi:transcriptional regulator with XRE-family HTH domain
MSSTGEKIRSARLYRGLSAEALAHKVGYATQSGIANLENRSTGRGGYKLTQIAQVLDVSLDWLLNDHDRTEVAQVPPFTIHPSSQSHCVKECNTPWVSPVHWPFQRITNADWQKLTSVEREILERQILGLVASKTNSQLHYHTQST